MPGFKPYIKPAQNLDLAQLERLNPRIESGPKLFRPAPVEHPNLLLILGALGPTSKRFGPYLLHTYPSKLEHTEAKV